MLSGASEGFAFLAELLSGPIKPECVCGVRSKFFVSSALDRSERTDIRTNGAYDPFVEADPGIVRLLLPLPPPARPSTFPALLLPLQRFHPPL